MFFRLLCCGHPDGFPWHWIGQMGQVCDKTRDSQYKLLSTNGQGASLGYFASFGSLGRILGTITGGARYGLSVGLPYLSGAAAGSHSRREKFK